MCGYDGVMLCVERTTIQVPMVFVIMLLRWKMAAPTCGLGTERVAIALHTMLQGQLAACSQASPGRMPIAMVAKAMMMMDSVSERLRAVASPTCPNSRAPMGRTTKPAAKMPLHACRYRGACQRAGIPNRMLF